MELREMLTLGGGWRGFGEIFCFKMDLTRIGAEGKLKSGVRTGDS